MTDSIIKLCADCGKNPTHTRNLCVACYQRNKRHGTIDRYPTVSDKPKFCKICNSQGKTKLSLCPKCYERQKSKILNQMKQKKYDEIMSNMKKYLRRVKI